MMERPIAVMRIWTGCLIALTGEHSVEDTIAKLREVSEKAGKRKPEYAVRTVQRAAQFVANARGNWRSRA